MWRDVAASVVGAMGDYVTGMWMRLMASLVLLCRGSAIQEMVGLEMGLNFTIYDTTINL